MLIFYIHRIFRRWRCNIKLLLLSQGRVVFAGAMRRVAEYFSSPDLGYVVPEVV